MKASHDTQSLHGKPVTVVLGRNQQVKQPATFRICPLGIQFYSPRAMPEFDVVEFTIHVPGRNGSGEAVQVTGVVVHCRPEKGDDSYRIWIKFLDLPESKRKRIECFAKSAETLCPYCENF